MVFHHDFLGRSFTLTTYMEALVASLRPLFMDGCSGWGNPRGIAFYQFEIACDGRNLCNNNHNHNHHNDNHDDGDRSPPIDAPTLAPIQCPLMEDASIQCPSDHSMVQTRLLLWELLPFMPPGEDLVRSLSVLGVH